MQINTIHNIVLRVLETNPKARDDDFILMRDCIGIIDTNALNMPLQYALSKHKVLNWESVARARRKIQNERPELRSSEKTQQARLVKESEFINYSKEI